MYTLEEYLEDILKYDLEEYLEDNYESIAIGEDHD